MLCLIAVSSARSSSNSAPSRQRTKRRIALNDCTAASTASSSMQKILVRSGKPQRLLTGPEAEQAMETAAAEPSNHMRTVSTVRYAANHW